MQMTSIYSPVFNCREGLNYIFEQISTLFTPNTGKYGPEKTPTLFKQCHPSYFTPPTNGYWRESFEQVVGP